MGNHHFKVNRDKTNKDPLYIHFECSDCWRAEKVLRNTWRLIISGELPFRRIVRYATARGA